LKGSAAGALAEPEICFSSDLFGLSVSYSRVENKFYVVEFYEREMLIIAWGECIFNVGDVGAAVADFLALEFR